MVTTATALGIINWCLNFVALLIFLSILIIIIKHRRELRTISIMLTANTCLAALLTCITICIMITSNLSTGFLTYNFCFCVIWGLLYDIFECLIYHSYYLQAFYRLCRVVFYKKKVLLSYSLYIILVFGQWLITIIILLPPVFLNWYTKLPTEQYCLVPYTDLIAEVYHIVILYAIPLLSIAIAYLWIAKYIRTSSRTSTMVLGTQKRRQNQRDLTVTKRIIILVSLLIALRFPTIIFMIYAISVGHLYPLTFGIVGLITSSCLIFIGLITIYITPELRKNFFVCLENHHNQVETAQIGRQHMVMPTIKEAIVSTAQQH
jgi:hypothetical protein